MLIWKAANGIIAEHPIFGVGTGDAKDVLMNEYAKKRSDRVNIKVGQIICAEEERGREGGSGSS